MKHEWMQKMVAQDEKNDAILIESMPEDMLNLIKLDSRLYRLQSHEQEEHFDKINYLGQVCAGWTCKKVKGANKCLSGLDNQGRVNSTV